MGEAMSEVAQPLSFGIVAEGAADHTVLKRILAGYFDNPDLATNPLQPLRDATGTFESGGWAQVLEYCQSEKFRSAFSFNDYIIIQIDTDISDKHPSYGISHHSESGPKSPEQLVSEVCAKLIEQMGKAFYDAHKQKILFAVCVHSIECWLLPLYWTDNRREKIINCMTSLNEQLSKQHGFSIDAKDPRYYDKAAKDYSKRKKLLAHWHHNPSLKCFIDHLEARFQRGFVQPEAKPSSR